MKIMKYVILTLMLAANILHSNAFAHGEDKPGPHGGLIRMPGAFHTELVPLNATEFKIYLLDINWKNPSVKNSSLQITISGKKKDKVECQTRENLYYFCALPNNRSLAEKSKLIVTSNREGQKGVNISYELPLHLKPHHQ